LRKAIIITSTAIAALVLSAAALAAAGSFNTYTATVSVSPSGAGTTAKPVADGFRTLLTASGTSGNRAAPLTDIKTTIYGLKSNGKDFPTCSATKIAASKSDSFCPKGALVAQGPVKSLLGAAIQPTSAGTPCNPYLHVWNAGQGKLTFFFVIIPPKYICATLSTGASAPYPGTLTQSGKNMVMNVPLPPDVSTAAGGLTGVYASLISEDLSWKKQTTKVKGKTVGYFQSVGCQKGKRPYSTAFTALSFAGASGTSTVSGSTGC
jgi:hypothetical protein